MRDEITAVRPSQLIYWDGVPKGLNTQFSAVCYSLQDCADLVHRFRGVDFYPNYGPMMPILLLVPGAPQQIAGWGLSTIEELRDQSVAVWELITERLAKTGSTVDFDALRERAGLMRREDVDPAIREAFVDRIRRHKASPVTDPPRQPHYVRVNEKTLHPVADPTSWKEGAE